MRGGVRAAVGSACIALGALTRAARRQDIAGACGQLVVTTSAQGGTAPDIEDLVAAATLRTARA